MQALVAQTREALEAWTPDAVNALGGRDVVFALGEHKLPFTTEGFLMSFSLPNFFFHATTAYDILRHKGAPIGKRDFLVGEGSCCMAYQRQHADALAVAQQRQHPRQHHPSPPHRRAIERMTDEMR